VWIEWNEFLKFLQKNRHLLPMPVTLSNESLDGLLKIDSELKQLRELVEEVIENFAAATLGEWAGVGNWMNRVKVIGPQSFNAAFLRGRRRRSDA
jgi:hypothetical protein